MFRTWQGLHFKTFKRFHTQEPVWEEGMGDLEIEMFWDER